ncbi:Yippee domain-containing protein [Mycena kentingensis (nom. inval.)]|nr:Yippee domain-containing protein [Mycena kentingensis (nom. inval.)]
MPPSAIPPESPRNFKGFSGRASLFTATYNVSQLAPKVQLMATGAHLLAELNCNTCSQYLGYKIVRAFDKSEEWKQDRFLLELAELNNPYTHFFPESDESDDSS